MAKRIIFSRCMSGWYSANPAIWLVSRTGSILPFGPLTVGGILTVVCLVAWYIPSFVANLQKYNFFARWEAFLRLRSRATLSQSISLIA